MSVTIQDGMLEAAKKYLSEADAKDYIFALVNYGITGEEPNFENIMMQFSFDQHKRGLRMSRKRSIDGRKGIQKRWDKDKAKNINSNTTKEEVFKSMCAKAQKAQEEN